MQTLSMLASAAVGAPQGAQALSNLGSLEYYGPEMGLIAAVLLIVAADLIVKEHRTKVLSVAGIALAALAYSGGSSLNFLLSGVEPQLLFGGLEGGGTGLIVFDDFTHVFRVLFAVVSGLIVLFVVPGMLDEGASTGERHNPGEMLMLLMVLTLGMNMMAASCNLLMIYLSIETVSVISFVMAGFKIGDRKSSEGALKYVIYGGVASGVMLYGMSWIYGLTHSFDLGEISVALSAMQAKSGTFPEAAFIGVACMLVGFGYKVSAAPFHMWTPDVYEGAPTPVTAFLSVGPKAAGMAVLIRFFADGLDASSASDAPWTVVLGCMAMATMTVGNLSALNQENVKRMLAYSSIAHAGYMLLGFCVFTQTGITAIVFYVVAYCFMNLGAFLIVMAIAETNGGDESMAAFRGLGRRAVVPAAVMTVFLVSLAGIPPLAGFVGKFYIFSALLESGGSWNWVLAVVGVLNSVVSLFYYARVIRAMYLEDATAGSEVITVRRIFGVTSFALAIPTLVLGVYWAPVYDFVARSLSRLH